MHCKLLGLMLSFLVAFGCSRGEAPAEPVESAAPAAAEAAPEPTAETQTRTDDHSSRNALDWAGTYSGVLPCASCPGIETVITLREDGTFERSMLYIDEAPLPKTENGTFAWDDAGQKISLDTGGTERQQYQVGENALFHLDQNGQRISGDLASQYVLDKHLDDPAITGKRWKLVELGGAPVAAGQGVNAAFLRLRAEDSVATGNTSCNTFSGRYAIKSGQRLSFARNMAVTMMACPDMSTESAFLDVLNQADSYVVGDDGRLSLNRARMAPLARFLLDDG